MLTACKQSCTVRHLVRIHIPSTGPGYFHGIDLSDVLGWYFISPFRHDPVTPGSVNKLLTGVWGHRKESGGRAEMGPTRAIGVPQTMKRHVPGWPAFSTGHQGVEASDNPVSEQVGMVSCRYLPMDLRLFVAAIETLLFFQLLTRGTSLPDLLPCPSVAGTPDGSLRKAGIVELPGEFEAKGALCSLVPESVSGLLSGTSCAPIGLGISRWEAEWRDSNFGLFHRRVLTLSGGTQGRHRAL